MNRKATILFVCTMMLIPVVSFTKLVVEHYEWEIPKFKSKGTSLYYVTEDTYGAISEKARKDLVMYSLNNDAQAIQSMFMHGLIVPLNVGTEVYLVKGGLRFNIVRKKGSLQDLWIKPGIIE